MAASLSSATPLWRSSLSLWARGGTQPLVVQYFERNRFEYHPENVGTPYEVLLGQLGTEVARKKGYPYGWYPLYGRAADYSWVSGRLVFDGRLCIVCGCTTVRYNQTGTFLDK